MVLKQEKLPPSEETGLLFFITLEVQDKDGTRCPHAKNEILVEVSGDGKLIGLDSGNQFSHELYKQSKRMAHDGRLLLTIKPSGKGDITVKCDSDGLQTGNIRIKR